jgi:hypothetical protein
MLGNLPEAESNLPKKLDFIIDQTYSEFLEVGLTEGQEIKIELAELISQRRKLQSELRDYRSKNAFTKNNLSSEIEYLSSIILQKIEQNAKVIDLQSNLQILKLDLKDLDDGELQIQNQINLLKIKIRTLYNKIRRFSLSYKQPLESKSELPVDQIEKNIIDSAQYFPVQVFSQISEEFKNYANLDKYIHQRDNLESISASWIENKDDLIDAKPNPYYEKYLQYYNEESEQNSLTIFFDNYEQPINQTSKVYQYFDTLGISMWDYLKKPYIIKSDDRPVHLNFMEKNNLLSVFGNIVSMDLFIEYFRNLVCLKEFINQRQIPIFPTSWFDNLEDLEDYKSFESLRVVAFPELDSLKTFTTELFNTFGQFVDAVKCNDVEKIQEIAKNRIQSKIKAQKIVPDDQSALPLTLGFRFYTIDRISMYNYFTSKTQESSSIYQSKIDEYANIILQTYFTPVQISKDPQLNHLVISVVENEEDLNWQKLKMQETLPGILPETVYGDRLRVKFVLDEVKRLGQDYTNFLPLLELINNLTDVNWQSLDLANQVPYLLEKTDKCLVKMEEIMNSKITSFRFKTGLRLDLLFKDIDKTEQEELEEQKVKQTEEFKIVDKLRDLSSKLSDVINHKHQSDLVYFDDFLMLLNMFDFKSLKYIFDNQLKDKTITIGNLADSFHAIKPITLSNGGLATYKEKIGNLNMFCKNLRNIYDSENQNSHEICKLRLKYIKLEHFNFNDSGMYKLYSNWNTITQDFLNQKYSVSDWNKATKELLDYIEKNYGDYNELSNQYNIYKNLEKDLKRLQLQFTM